MADACGPIDKAYEFIFWFSIVFTVVITVAMVWFVYKYKRKAGVKSEPTGHYQKLEIFWTVTPIIFIVVLFHVGFSQYIKNATAAEGAVEIRARAKKWTWEFEYPTGDRLPGGADDVIAGKPITVDEGLHLEINKPVKIIISSDDVLHSFYIPQFRMKRDAVPGQYSFIAFTPTVLGEANVFCAEYCGMSHSGMLGKVIVETPEQHKEFLKTLGKCTIRPGDPPDACQPAKWGERLFSKNGCPTCHGPGGAGELAGTKTQGPRLVGLYMKPGGEQMSTGQMITPDENYIRESILRPQAKIVMNYNTVTMPTFAGMKDEQLDALIAYIKGLK
jgi:cytochrome c oxidase subunit 2